MFEIRMRPLFSGIFFTFYAKNHFPPIPPFPPRKSLIFVILSSPAQLFYPTFNGISPPPSQEAQEYMSQLFSKHPKFENIHVFVEINKVLLVSTLRAEH